MKSNSYDRRAAAGGSWVGNLIWFVLAIAVIFVSLRMVNPKLHEYYIDKKIEDLGRFEGLHMKPEQIQQAVFEYAQAEKIPLKLEDIIVTKTGYNVSVHITYVEIIDLIVVKYPYKVDLEKSSNNL